MSTIKAVADLAGVSVGTVSHVITGSVPVSDPLRNKVNAAIRELDYHPNHVARSLKTSRTGTLGIIVPDLTVSFFPQVIRGAEAAARDRGYTLIAVNSDDDGDRQKELLSILRSQRAEGILLAVAAAPAPVAQITRMMQAGIPELRNSHRLISEFFKSGTPQLEIVLNRYVKSSMGVDEEHIEKALTKPIAWKIPSDYYNVRRMQNEAVPLALDDSSIARVIQDMARSACGMPPKPEKRKGFSLFK